MRQFKSLILLAVFALVAGTTLWQHRAVSTDAAGPAAATSVVVTPTGGGQTASPSTAVLASMPLEVRATLAKIASGGPFEHAQDGAVFGNYEHLLPSRPRGYYHEYTVATPGAHARGARRIVVGGTPPVVYYYTDDHYRSFRRFESDQ